MDKDSCRKDSRENRRFNENSFCCEDDFFSERDFDIDLSDRSDCCDDFRPNRREKKNSCHDFGNRKPHHKKDEDDCDDHGHNRSNDKKEDKDNKDCCCKKDLEKLFWFLFNPCVKDLINENSILLGSTFFWFDNITKVQKSCTCKGLLDFSGTIHLTNPNSSANPPAPGSVFASNFTTSFCDLIAISFQLNPLTGNNQCCTCKPLNADTCFRRELLKLLGCCDRDCCHVKDEECCCNKAKSACLCDTIGRINIIMNRTVPDQRVPNVTVIAVTDNLIVVREAGANPFYHIICLNAVGAIY